MLHGYWRVINPDRIGALRVERGVSHQRIADATRHSKTWAIYALRGDNRIEAYDAKIIARLLGAPVAELFAPAERPSRQSA